MKYIFLTGLIPLLLLACSQAEPSVAAEIDSKARPMPVRVLTLGQAKVESTQGRYTGIVQAGREVAVGVNVGGQVQEVLVNEGDFVEAGAPIMQLDQRRLNAGLESMQAQIQGAQARLDELVAGPRKETIAAARANRSALQEELRLAELRLVRRRGLLESSSISQEEVDVNNAQVLTIRARLQGAEASLEELVNGTRPEILAAQRATLAGLQASLVSLEIDLADSRVSAPFSGRIQQVLVHEGAVVPAGTGVVLLVETGALEAHFGLSDKHAHLLQGDRFSVEVGGQVLTVLDKRSLPNLDPSARTLPWILDLDTRDADPAIHPGQVATLSWTRDLGQPGWRIPLSALTEGVRGMWTGFVVVEIDGDSHVQAVDLEIIHTLADAVVVRGALKAGDRLLLDGVDRIVAGQRVQVTHPTEDQPRD
ncbi:MAG: biotin/lipoyl-binding protein [Planctomycetota bacterium]|nr:biotin/lipoyl-binding protein [Planctomycetota bacterium]